MGDLNTHLYTGVIYQKYEHVQLDHFCLSYLSLSLFCLLLSTAFFLSLKKIITPCPKELTISERCVYDKLGDKDSINLINLSTCHNPRKHIINCNTNYDTVESFLTYTSSEVNDLILGIPCIVGNFDTPMPFEISTPNVFYSDTKTNAKLMKICLTHHFRICLQQYVT